MDGGTVYNSNVNSAILQCLDMVDDESKITVDVFVCDDSKYVAPELSITKTIGNILRGRAVHKGYNGTNNLTDAMRAHPDVNYRYLVYENANKASGISEIEFDGEKTWIFEQWAEQWPRDWKHIVELYGFPEDLPNDEASSKDDNIMVNQVRDL